MLVTMKKLLDDAKANKYAVGAFNVPTLEAVRAVIAAAEEVGTPVILAHAQVHEPVIPIEEIGPIMLGYASRANVPVAVHLDHGSSFDLCIKAIRLGFTSVMFDASDKSFEENLRGTKEMVRIAHAAGVSVEAELGHVFTSKVGGEADAADRVAYSEASHESNDIYTDPELAKQFVNETDVDCLAIAFGTVHGLYITKPRLDLDRISKIADKVGVPLVMHGGSGVSKDNYKIAIANGISKINYFAYMNKAGGEAVKKYINGLDNEVAFFDEISTISMNAMKENVKAAMKIFISQKGNIIA